MGADSFFDKIILILSLCLDAVFPDVFCPLSMPSFCPPGVVGEETKTCPMGTVLHTGGWFVAIEDVGRRMTTGQVAGGGRSARVVSAAGLSRPDLGFTSYNARIAGIALFTQHPSCYQPVLTSYLSMLDNSNLFPNTTAVLVQVFRVLGPRFLHLLPHFLVDLICASSNRSWVHAQAFVWDLS